MEIDERIEEKARFNPYIHASIQLWKKSMTESVSMPEREFLIRLVLLLDAVYTDLLQECRRYHETTRHVKGILLEKEE